MTTTNQPSSRRTYYGWHIDTVYDDEQYDRVLGYDVMEPGSCSTDQPWDELVPTLTECREIIRTEAKFQRQFGWVMR